MLDIQIDRHRCIGAGNCITIAPTAFDWLKGEAMKAELADPTSVDEDLLREAMLSCPTQAIVMKQVEEMMPWQLRGAGRPDSRRVMKTFMFTDIVKSTNLLEAIGDDAYATLIQWHDETIRSILASHQGEEIMTTGDGFFVGFDSPETAVACAVAIQRKTQGFAPQVRIGLHASDATQAGTNFRGKGVHEAARISALAEGGEILASSQTATAGRYPASEMRTVSLKGISEPVEIVSIDWR